MSRKPMSFAEAKAHREAYLTRQQFIKDNPPKAASQILKERQIAQMARKERVEQAKLPGALIDPVTGEAIGHISELMPQPKLKPRKGEISSPPLQIDFSTLKRST